MKDRMKTMRSLFNYETTFGTESVQGTAGIVSIKNDEDSKIVFKVSNCIDYSIEHESVSLDTLNKLANFCPHFMYKFGSFDLPVSHHFFKNPSKQGIFEEPTQLMMTPVLFTEYISKFTFYHAIKTYDKNIYSSMLLQVFSALKISQQKSAFTHYDLHMDNILVRKGDPSVLHLYLYDKDELLVPTYGLTPVIIDMGSCHTSNHIRMFSNSDNYENGLQTTSFDRLADIHHLLLSTFSCLERYTEIGKQLMLKIAFMFYPLPVWKEKGWKILFNHLDKELKELIRKNSKLMNTSGSKDDRDDYQHLFSELFSDFISVLNGAITLPFQEMTLIEKDFDKFTKDLTHRFDSFFKHLHILINFSSVKSDQDCLYLLKEIINCAYNVRTIQSQAEKDKASNNLNLKLKLNLKDSEIRQLKVGDMIKSINELVPYIAAFYSHLEKQHNQFINETYKECPPSIDSFIDFFRQHIPCEVELTNKHNIYVFDTEKECMEIVNVQDLNLSEKELVQINKMTLRQKANYLRKLIQM